MKSVREKRESGVLCTDSVGSMDEKCPITSPIDDQARESSSRRLHSNRRQRGQPTRIDMLNVPAGPNSRYGFRLRITHRDCTRCSLCPWYNCCIGCTIPDDDYPTIIQDGDSITLDWHMDVYNAALKNDEGSMNKKYITQGKTHFEMGENIPKHHTCKDDNFGDERITLEECLDAFAKEERIPEAYCSKCKDFRVSTKRMSLWRLPPVMIIHLKRFQFTQHMRRKLRNLVSFPLEGLDFSRIVASDSSTDSVIDMMKGSDDNDELGDHNSGETDGVDIDPSRLKSCDENCCDPDINVPTGDRKEPSESLYDLYGVIHHQGALSTGHYFASLLSETDGKWRLFNDDRVYDVEGKSLVDHTAYILFYVRRDVKTADLSDFWDTSARDGEGMTEEQIDKLTKQRERCAVS